MLKAIKIINNDILYESIDKVNFLPETLSFKKSIERFDFIMICDRFFVFTDKY
jgi:hypothetical protein